MEQAKKLAREIAAGNADAIARACPTPECSIAVVATATHNWCSHASTAMKAGGISAVRDALRGGRGLRLVVQGRDVQQYPRPVMADRHEASVNQGTHSVFGGGRYESYLLVPEVPER